MHHRFGRFRQPPSLLRTVNRSGGGFFRGSPAGVVDYLSVPSVLRFRGRSARVVIAAVEKPMRILITSPAKAVAE